MVGDNTGKLVLIPHKLYLAHAGYRKGGLLTMLSPMDEPASD
jgi:hypothetical protein